MGGGAHALAAEATRWKILAKLGTCIDLLGPSRTSGRHHREDREQTSEYSAPRRPAAEDSGNRVEVLSVQGGLLSSAHLLHGTARGVPARSAPLIEHREIVPRVPVRQCCRLSWATRSSLGFAAAEHGIGPFLARHASLLN